MFRDLRFIIVSLGGRAVKEYITESIEIIPIVLKLVNSPCSKAVASKLHSSVWSVITKIK